jgi:hypothetical protein
VRRCGFRFLRIFVHALTRYRTGSRLMPLCVVGFQRRFDVTVSCHFRSVAASLSFAA